MLFKKKGRKEKEGSTCGCKNRAGRPCGRPLYDNEHCILSSDN
jgi:hypothetical protein